MDNGHDMLQLCRLCLVKDDVNIPIFQEHDDNSEIFVKISSCLPVKLERNDKLPQNICDSCFSKLDVVYDLWTTSSNSDKQLHKWLYEAEAANAKEKRLTKASNKSGDAIVKQEKIDDAHETVTYVEEVPWDGASSSAGPSASLTAEDEPPPKRARRAAAVKASITVAAESDDDDDDDNGPMTKMEDDSDEDDPTFGDVPSTSADDQPGPSGVGKDGSEAPDPKQRNNKLKREYNSDEEYLPDSLEIQNDGDDVKKTPRRRVKQRPVVKESRMKTWICKVCLDEFPTKKELMVHKIAKHSNDIKERVEEIKYEYDQDQDVYTCANCSAEFQDESEVKVHVESHVEKYDCEFCKITIKGAYLFSVHIQKHREDQMFPCPCCSYITNRRTTILVHINRMHLNKYDFQCNTCGKCYNDALSFKEHENVHLGIKPFVCVVCNKEFVYSRYLTTHQTRLHTVRVIDENSKTQCKYCMKIFAKQETLENHVLTKHETNRGPYDKKHLCDVCGQGFSRKDKLKIHYRKHSGEKPFSCSYCGKSFIKKDYMIMHERVHSGEKPYSCEFCGKCFNQGAPLRIHLRSHTGERPYLCPYCNLGCISRGALNAHIKSCVCSI